MPRKNTKQSAATDNVVVAIVINAYGSPQPQLKLTAAAGTHQRSVKAALFRIAAEVEQRSIFESWSVRVEQDHDIVGRVILDLCDATPEEAERGAELLRAVVGGMR